MTTANLMKIPSVNANFAPQTETSKKLQDEELKVAEAFAGLMNQTAFVSNQVVDETSSNMDVKVSSTQSAAESYERYSYKDKQIDTAEEPTVNEQLEEVAEDLEAAEQEVMHAISEEYGVSEEEIQSVLDEMGLDVLDLLNPENLVNFIMQLTGVASSEELLLDESFLSIMETMDALTEGLMKDLDVDMEGLQALVNQMENISEETELPEDFQQMLETVTENPNVQTTEESVPVVENTQTVEDVENVETLETSETTIMTDDTEMSEHEVVVDDTEKSDATVTVANESETENTEDGINVQVEKKDDVSEVKMEHVDTEEITVEKTAEKPESFTGNQNSEGNSFLNHNSNTENVVLNQSNVTMNTVADAAQTQFASYLSTDTVQIMEQIVNQMKVTISPETTSMEMQLNPENLGKVYVNISSEEGVINAQFRATNEIVKEALETQIATLRENLNQAGVKVDAIEVTIASHEFERNLEQNHHNPEDAQGTQNEQTTKRRNISVDSLDELSGVMTEEETLVAQIMKDNGNSVDFTA
ncbi:MAG: flagellar hook-length control protein FliK [Agathobacter sp.]|nr:flagellar hook-length control protein FliK [Agathobacter sp.]